MTDNVIFLTGGTGYIGANLRQRLASKNHPVQILARPRTVVDAKPNETIVRGDIIDGFDIKDAKTVIHLAAQTGVDEAIHHPEMTWKVNATGTMNVLEAARDASIEKFLFVSTASIYGPPESLPVSESHPLNATDPYGASKLAADRLVQAYHRTYGLDTIIARPFNTYGPKQPNHNVVPEIIRQGLKSDKVELGNLSPSRDFLYVDDVINAFMTLLRKGKSGENYNIGSGNDITIKRLAEMIINQIDTELTIQSSKDRQRDDDIEIMKLIADITKIESLGWQPEWDLENGLQKTIRWFREHYK